MQFIIYYLRDMSSSITGIFRCFNKPAEFKENPMELFNVSRKKTYKKKYALKNA